MASFYVEASGSNTYPFSSRETAAISFYELFNAFSLNSYTPSSADIIYLHGLVYEPNDWGYYELEGATVEGTDALIDIINMSVASFSGGRFINIGMFTDEPDAEYNSFIYLPVSVVHCRFDGRDIAGNAIYSYVGGVFTSEIFGNTFENFISYAITISAQSSFKQFVSLGQTSRNWTGIAAAPNGDVYACVVNGDIYKQTGGTGNFVALGQGTNAWSHLTVAPNGDVYVCVNNVAGDIYKQTGGTGNFVALGQASTFWISCAAAPNGDIYACVNTGDIYKQTGGTGNFVALGQTLRNWVSLGAASNGDIYATVAGGDIYKQTGGVGDFIALGQTSRQWYGVTARSNGDIYATVNGGDIYKQTGGTGNFVALGQAARNWYDLTTDSDDNILGCVFPGGIYKMSFTAISIDLSIVANSINNSNGLRILLTTVSITQLHLFNNAFNSDTFSSPISIVLITSQIIDFIHQNNISNISFLYTEDTIPFSPDITEIVADALFLDDPSNPLLIDNSSPCYHTGRSLTGILSTDIIGVLYEDPPSIGAYEVSEGVPTIEFKGVPVVGYSPLTVKFTDISTGGVPTAWLWEFGDGTTSLLENPTHTYEKPGNYKVSLTVSISSILYSTSKTNYIICYEIQSGDIWFGFNSDSGSGDIEVRHADLKRDPGFETAVFISLFTDKRAVDSDLLPANSTDRRGWWADSTIGSRLWLLEREVVKNEISARARQYCQEALQWMISDGIASKIEVDCLTSAISPEVRITIKIYQRTNGPLSFIYYFNWKEQTARRE